MTEQPNEGLVARIVGWIRAGYPDAVPQQDYVALLGILQRSLTPTELEEVVEALSSDAENGHAVLTPDEVRDRVEDVVKGPAMTDDLARVSARLAAVGWPLWSGHESLDVEPAPVREAVRPGLVAKIVGWLREGYPDAMPQQDYVALVALLRRRLTDAEVAQVSRELVDAGTVPPDQADVGAAIAKVTSELPSEEDVARVRAYLTDHGWPVDFVL
jgi:uncharacterized protein (DUF2267 family)